MTDTAAIKSKIDFRTLVRLTHDIDRAGKIQCPAHHDEHPSCQVYEDHAFCFACGWHADVIRWLEKVQGMSTGDAIREAERLAGVPLWPEPRRKGGRKNGKILDGRRCEPRPLPDSLLKRHVRRVENTHRVPPALLGRGFARDHLEALLIAEADEGGDALFPILGPEGELLNIKRRFAHKRDGQRYAYEVTGRGAPAWCSPGILEAEAILVMEGELNAMISWIARPDLGVMGPAGANGCLHMGALKGQTVFIYADKDEAGDKARERWVNNAREAGASRVLVLDPWPDGDACDVAGLLSLEALRKRLA